MVAKTGGEGGIRTPGTGFSQYNGLANRRIQPLCHLSAAKSVQHCSLERHLVTVPPSIAAFWRTLSPKCHQTLRASRLRPARNRDLCAYEVEEVECGSALEYEFVLKEGVPVELG